jgi:hypothetical protein
VLPKEVSWDEGVSYKITQARTTHLKLAIGSAISLCYNPDSNAAPIAKVHSGTVEHNSLATLRAGDELQVLITALAPATSIPSDGKLALDGDITYSIDNKVYLGRFSLDDTAYLLLRHARAYDLNAVSLPCVLHLTLEGGSLGRGSVGAVDVVGAGNFFDEGSATRTTSRTISKWSRRTATKTSLSFRHDCRKLDHMIE